MKLTVAAFLMGNRTTCTSRIIRQVDMLTITRTARFEWDAAAPLVACLGEMGAEIKRCSLTAAA
jgi:hypothetical protein